MTCLVERTAWEQADFRNDIYVRLCYDGEGSKSYMIHVIGEAEKAEITADQKPLLDDLCAYRSVLCASNVKQ